MSSVETRVPDESAPPEPDAPDMAAAAGVQGPEAGAPLLIAEACRGALRTLIAENDGREVFVIGSCGESGLIEELEPMAFGNWESVPAPAQNARAGQVMIHNHPSGVLEPSSADISVASLYGKAGIGFYIIDNQVERVRVVVKPFRETRAVSVDVQALLDHFGPAGELARTMPGYEYRPQQLEMMERVAEAFNDDRIAVVEAGTGTGKSFAYLAPALAWALENRRRVTVSTNTINLQEQLLNKDLPELRRRLGWNFKAVLVKGRSNYVSLRRLALAAADTQLFPDERSHQLQQLQAWARKTRDGSRSDLPFEVGEEAWEAAMSDKDDCLRARCPHFNDCFFYKSRREAAAADVVVANHHLVMADIALRREAAGTGDFVAILPPYDRVVFDEAHHLEEVATAYFSTESSLPAIRRPLQQLASTRDNRGIVHRLHRALFSSEEAGLYPMTPRVLRILEEDVLARRRETDAALEEHFEELFHITLRHFRLEELGRRERRELRITEAVTASPFWREAESLIEAIAAQLASVETPLRRVLDILASYPDEIARELVDHATALQAAATKLAEHRTALHFFLTSGDEDYCRWLEVGYVRDRPIVRPCTAPLDVAPNLRSALFSRKKTVVLTSATLTVDGRFDYIARQLGLKDFSPARRTAALGRGEADEETRPPEDTGDVEENDGAGAPETDGELPVAERTSYLRLGTPFDYRKSCMLGVTLDTEVPTSPAFDSAIVPVIEKALAITGGRAFVLFTSYRALEKVYTALRPVLTRAGMNPIRQGEMPRSRLVDAFRSTPRSVLFATSSFWEGVDVPGRALECLILTRLPFSVPTTPILEARTERIDRRGGNSFTELTVPMAVIRFKQGFGRLIRTKNDRGIVLVLDHRVVTKSYGKTFLRSLPAVEVVQDNTDQVISELERFYRSLT